jgi:hypothetical protein
MLTLVGACGGSADDTAAGNEQQAAQDLAVPKSVSWNIDLENPVNLSSSADWFDIDLFDNVSTGYVDTLHAKGKKVICYFSAGSYESNRPDKAQFPKAAIGKKMDGWPENWLDTRSAGVRTVMKKRMDLASSIGCDGVDPDNVDGYSNDTGFALTAKTQLDYNQFLATEAHARGLVVGLKNDVDQIAALEPYFDFAVNESCFQYAECDKLRPFTHAGKSVLGIEYHGVSAKKTSVCPKARSSGFFTILSEQDRLNGTYTRCTP